MKKKNKGSAKTPDSEQSFPVDTLGIPILVDIVASTTASQSEDAKETVAGNFEPQQEPPTPRLIEEQSGKASPGTDLDQLADKIIDSVTGEIMATLEPVVRDKVALALRMYQDQRLCLPDEGSGKKPKSD